MKVVTLNPDDDAIKLLTDAIQDIHDSGIIPNQCVIITDDLRYCTGITTEDELIGILQRQIVDMCLPDEE